MPGRNGEETARFKRLGIARPAHLVPGSTIETLPVHRCAWIRTPLAVTGLVLARPGGVCHPCQVGACALLMAFAAQLMVARVMKSRQGELLLPAGLEVKVAASLLGLFLGALILLFPFTP